MTQIAIDGVSKSFANGVRALSDLSLAVHDGEILTCVGPSGCGKTTTLRILAGLETPSSGRILEDGIDITDVPAHRRNIAMAFQRPALYPTKTVAANLAFSLRMRRSWWPSRVCQTEQYAIDDIVRRFELDALLSRYPHQLSGGQQQRVALARALLQSRSVLLLDEPLNHVDAPLRRQLRDELRRFLRQKGLTAIYVTHDPTEALELGDRVAVLRQGRLQQIGKPSELVTRPNHRFVAEMLSGPIRF